MNNNDAIFEKARELGELIKASDVRQRSEEASKALLSDETAKGLIDSYNKLREDKMAEFTEKQPTQEEAQEVNNVLQAEFEKMAENDIIKEYLEAARSYEMVLGQMDSILKHFIVGERKPMRRGADVLPAEAATKIWLIRLVGRLAACFAFVSRYCHL